MKTRAALGVLAISLLCAVTAPAETTLVGGKSARLVNRTGTDRDLATFRITKDPSLFTLIDPCSAPTTLRLRTSGQDSGDIPLPCAKWRRAGTGFLYIGSPGDPGGVQRVLYKSGRLIANLKGNGYGALTGPVSFVEARFSVGATRYCGRFSDLRTNKPDVVAARGPSAGCTPICGDGHVDGGEQCDDGNTTSGDCCSATCQFEVGACDDGSHCTVGDTCVGATCVGTTAQPWVNEFDYDDFTGVLDDRDEFVEIAAPAGTDLGGYRLVAVEGNLNGNTQTNGAPCYSDITSPQVPTGNPYFIGVLPAGTTVADDTGTGIGFVVVCFSNTSANHEVAGDCDVVLPAPDPGSNLKNGYLVNTNVTDCPDGILLLDPLDGMVDSLSYEGQVPNMGIYGPLFQIVPYSVGQDQGFKARVSFEKRTSSLARATAASEWHLSGGCVDASTADATCVEFSDSPGHVNPGQILSCTATCGNGNVDSAAGELCDPAAVPSGCGPGFGCIAAGEAGECTCENLCGNDNLDDGEECDPPGSETCGGGSACNSDCTCPPAPTCNSVVSYSVAESGIDLCTAIGGPCPAPVPVGLLPVTTQTTFDVCFRAADAAGRVAMTIDPQTWFADATFVPSSAALPVALTQRFCQSTTATGTLFTQTGPTSFPAKRCLTGDPLKLLASCAQSSDCDGPAPTAGNGLCLTRDVGYTSTTNSSGTAFAFGDGTGDAAGAMLVRQVLDAQVFLGSDVRCPGDGVNVNCVGCDGVTPAPPGRIGVNKTATATITLPLVNHWVTSSVGNIVNQPGNAIHLREVSGSGALRDAFAGGDYELAACGAKLQIPTPLGVNVDIQFMTKQLWTP